MAFWNSVTAADPKRNFRFKIQFDGLKNNSGANASIIWYAKKVGKPNFTVTESKHSYLNHTFYWPGRVEWQEINMTLVDPQDPYSANALNKLMKEAGYAPPGSPQATSTLGKAKSKVALGEVVISQMNSDGETIEQWTLHAPFIKSVKYGELDYESDDLTTLEIGLRYDWAECKITKNNGGGEETGFSTVADTASMTSTTIS